jgi:hypothetical protein
LVFTRKFSGAGKIVFVGIGFRKGEIIEVQSLTPRQLRDLPG